MTKSDQEFLSEVRKRCEEATPAPWYMPKIGQRLPRSCGMYSDTPPYHPGTIVEYEVWAKALHQEEVPYIASYMQEQDASFIAHSRQDVPRLLTIIEKLEKQIEKLSPSRHSKDQHP